MLALVALDERVDLLVGRAALEPPLDPDREHRDRRGAVRVSITRTLSPPSNSAARLALANVPESVEEIWSERIRSYCAELLVHREEVAGRRL